MHQQDIEAVKEECNCAIVNNQSDLYPIYFHRKTSRRSSNASTKSNQRRVRQVKRLVRKSGRSSVVYHKTHPQHFYRYCLDLSNTLINSHWKWTLLTLSSVFILTWLCFACFWMIISIANHDSHTNQTNSCLNGIDGFAGYLLFSIETQTTIGYGNRHITDQCPEAIFLMCLQITIGACICGSLVCIVYLKITSPERLHSMNCFSKFAVICQHDGALCLVFRVRDCMSRRFENLSAISAFLVFKIQQELLFKAVKLEKCGFLIWPIEVVHRIDQKSPLWDVSAKDLLCKRFEIVVIMEGYSQSSSLLSQTKTSYLNREILWGHRFAPCIRYDTLKNSYSVNHKLFNKTVEVVTPLCSSKRFHQVFDDIFRSNLSSPLSNKQQHQDEEDSSHSCSEDDSNKVLDGNFRKLFNMLQKFVMDDNKQRKGVLETSF